MSFIHARQETVEYGELAALLVAMADEAGIHPREIQTVTNGFLVPDAISEALQPQPIDPRTEGKTPPDGWDEPLDAVDVTFEDGKVYLTSEAREALVVTAGFRAAGNQGAIRAWAKEQGIDAPARGRLPLAVVEAFYRAHED